MVASSNNAIDNTVGASISGVTNTLTITNPSNTASSAARETIVVGGGTAGDPTINWNVSGVTNWEMGIDNSVSDNLTISNGTSLGTNDVWRMTTGNQRTMPLQCAFSATLNSNDSNVTGDGTVYVIGTNVAWTKRFDQGTNFNTNGTFTAPVTGRYFFTVQCRFTNLTAAHVKGELEFQTTAVTYFNNTCNPGAMRETPGITNGLGLGNCYFTDMTAGDTAKFSISVNGSTKTVGLLGAGGATYFSGFLVC